MSQAGAATRSARSRTMIAPTCQLWTDPDAVLDRARGLLVCVRTFLNDSHDARAQMQCSCCGRLCFWDWHEEIDWDDGDDPTFETWVPVRGESEIAALLAMSPGWILAAPSLRNDRPKGRPRRFGWNGDPSGPFRLPERA